MSNTSLLGPTPVQTDRWYKGGCRPKRMVVVGLRRPGRPDWAGRRGGSYGGGPPGTNEGPQTPSVGRGVMGVRAEVNDLPRLFGFGSPINDYRNEVRVLLVTRTQVSLQRVSLVTPDSHSLVLTTLLD